MLYELEDSERKTAEEIMCTWVRNCEKFTGLKEFYELIKNVGIAMELWESKYQRIAQIIEELLRSCRGIVEELLRNREILL